MKISLVTPAAKGSRSGNRVTAVRWARLLRRLGYELRVSDVFDSAPADLLVAIHAYRCAGAITAWRQAYPGCPVVVLLAGTDIYRFQRSHPDETLASMEIADRLIGLHEGVADGIPARFRDKLRIVFQSALPLPGPREPSKKTRDICVVGHLREEKDPLRAALAVRELPENSRTRILHLGKAHDEEWAKRARVEMVRNGRYIWRGEVSHGLVRKAFARCHAMIISSVMEGGANVVSEAVVAGLPVLASKIPGNVGLLGAEHPAYFPARDTAALTDLLRRTETDPEFLANVALHANARAPLFHPHRELTAWQGIIDELR
jgi:putative glycosyltransferase (TIGR04348 family)